MADARSQEGQAEARYTSRGFSTGDNITAGDAARGAATLTNHGLVVTGSAGNAGRSVQTSAARSRSSLPS